MDLTENRQVNKEMDRNLREGTILAPVGHNARESIGSVFRPPGARRLAVDTSEAARGGQASVSLTPGSGRHLRGEKAFWRGRFPEGSLDGPPGVPRPGTRKSIFAITNDSIMNVTIYHCYHSWLCSSTPLAVFTATRVAPEGDRTPGVYSPPDRPGRV